MERTKRYIALHNDFCSPILANHPHVYHHTPFIAVRQPAECCVLEYAAQDKSQGYAGIFQLSNRQNATYQFKPRGIDRSRTYMITLDNEGCSTAVTGHELMEQGITIRLDHAGTSELVMYTIV